MATIFGVADQQRQLAMMVLNQRQDEKEIEDGGLEGGEDAEVPEAGSTGATARLEDQLQITQIGVEGVAIICFWALTSRFPGGRHSGGPTRWFRGRSDLLLFKQAVYTPAAAEEEACCGQRKKSVWEKRYIDQREGMLGTPKDISKRCQK
ncbi:hypothetical protein HPP92_017015 [Vanilla planifolia]|uniref:Uncharacterized protein n=1 Tax=Vanilla planifolia TaxID=51239 RepID=A0A835QMJ2_VANPL|nr:hypothetical protein HPP92_017015 [Vanilla planifolia]